MLTARSAPQDMPKPRIGRFSAVLLVGAALVAAALILAPASAAASLILVLLLIVIAIAYPIAALYVLPFAVAFGSLFAVSVHGVSIGPTDATVTGLSLSWLLRNPGVTVARMKAFAGRDRLRAATVAALLAYLLVICLSILIASDRISALKEVVKWVEVTVVLALALWLLRSREQVRTLLWCAIAAGVVEALLGLVQWAVPSAGADDLRVFGTFAQPNPYAGYLNLALPLALAIAIFANDVRERWVACGASILLAVALYFSTSRGGFLGLIAALATLALAGIRKPRFAVPALLGVIVVGALAWLTGVIPSALQQRVLHSLRLEDLSLGGSVTAQNFSTMERLAHWAAGLRMFAAHPILGVGAGNYNASYPRYAIDLATWPDSLGHAHNYYINAAAETGVLGLLAFLAVSICALVAAWRLVRAVSTANAKQEPADQGYLVPRALALGLFAVFVAFTVHNATDDLFVHGMELQFAVYLACLFARRPETRDTI